MVLRQEQIRQLRFPTFRAAARVVSASRSLKLANDAVGSERRKKFDLTISRWSGLPVSEIYDFALLPAFDGRMRLIHKTLKSLRKPMVASSLLALRAHSLLNNGPAAIVGDDKGMKIELEAVLHRGAIDLGYQPTCFCEFGAVEAYSFSDQDQLMRGLSRKSSAATAHMDAKFILQWSKAAFQGTNHTRGDTGRMPVHAHDGTERLEPKGMSKTAQQLIAPVMVHDRLTHHGTETGHAIRKPARDASTMKRKDGTSRSARHR